LVSLGSCRLPQGHNQDEISCIGARGWDCLTSSSTTIQPAARVSFRHGMPPSALSVARGGFDRRFRIGTPRCVLQTEKDGHRTSNPGRGSVVTLGCSTRRSFEPNASVGIWPGAVEAVLRLTFQVTARGLWGRDSRVVLPALFSRGERIFPSEPMANLFFEAQFDVACRMLRTDTCCRESAQGAHDRLAAVPRGTHLLPP